VGWAAFPFIREHPGDLGWEAVVNIADQALYRAKREGRDRWVGLVATDEVRRDGVERRATHDLDDMIATGEVTLLRSRS
jgi:hypothetical protein